MTKNAKEYTFANAYLGSHVKNLMSRQDLMRVASSRDLAAAEAVLQEFGYGEGKDIFGDDLEYFMREEQKKLFDLVFNTLSDRKALGMFLFPYDYHNIKVFLKAEFLGITVDDTYLVSTSFIDPKKLEVMIRDRNLVFLSSNMRAAITEAVDLVGRSGDPQQIDIIMDRACYNDMLKGAMRTEDEFLIGYVKLQIDILNLTTFVRLRQINKPWSFFQKVFLEGGNISEKFFITSYEEPYAQLADKLAPYGLKELMAEGGREVKETGDFGLFEKMGTDKMMDYTKKAKYQSFGIAPIAAYWIAKETEIDNLRIVLAGKLAGLSAEVIGERLREPYV
ncbi:MAG: V-type ATPase subunit [Eubacteriales bacterium]|nr:V-type ATPase subunit [Eubacteriales bacterium]